MLLEMQRQTQCTQTQSAKAEDKETKDSKILISDYQVIKLYFGLTR